jgi:general secretion pathway protein G
MIQGMQTPALPLNRPAARRQRGFTLIELMVVLAIIGVLAALIVPNVLGRADDARITAARTDVGNLMQALKLYRLDNQRFPTGAQGLNALVLKPTTEPIPGNWKPYLEKLPNDPWGRPYQYMNPGIRSEVEVLSFGADGQPGGEGNNADIGSWQEASASLQPGLHTGGAAGGHRPDRCRHCGRQFVSARQRRQCPTT